MLNYDEDVGFEWASEKQGNLDCSRYIPEKWWWVAHDEETQRWGYSSMKVTLWDDTAFRSSWSTTLEMDLELTTLPMTIDELMERKPREDYKLFCMVRQ